MGLFELSPNDFLALYSIVVLIALGLAFLLRWALRSPGGRVPEVPSLHPYEVAHLAEGEVLAIHTAVARLLQGGQLTVGESTGKVFREGQLPPDAHPLERQLYEVAIGRVTVYNANTKVTTDDLATRLQGLGLELSPRQAAWASWAPAALLIAVAVFGVIKFALESTGEQPLDYVLLGAIAVPVAGIVFALFWPPLRTRRGDNLLHALREQNAALEAHASKQPEALPSAELTLAVALFGITVLTTGPLSKLRRAIQSPPSAADAGEIELPPPVHPPETPSGPNPPPAR